MTIFAFEVPANRDYQINQHGWTQWLDYLKVMKIQLQQNAPPAAGFSDKLVRVYFLLHRNFLLLKNPIMNILSINIILFSCQKVRKTVFFKKACGYFIVFYRLLLHIILPIFIYSHAVVTNRPKIALQNFSRNLQILLIIQFCMNFSCFQVVKNPSQLF